MPTLERQWDDLINSISIDPETPSDMDIEIGDNLSNGLGDDIESDGLADFKL